MTGIQYQEAGNCASLPFAERTGCGLRFIDGKRFYSLDLYLKRTFGQKVYKIALDGGMTCPNRDGTLGTKGCIFCSSGGSGDFAGKRLQGQSVTTQIDKAISQIQTRKHTGSKFIAYFQSYTNTYAPVEYLRTLFFESIAHPDIVGLSIGTRPDCLPVQVLDLLSELNQTTTLEIELGLQTIHDSTARFIRRGYALPVFEQAVHELHRRGISIIVHLILGLPGEDAEEIFETIQYINRLPIQGVKLQLLHVLDGTDLKDHLGSFHILSMEEYISLVIECLKRLRPDIVIHRLTGDGPKDLLLAPLWSTQKRVVLNTIGKRMKEEQFYQGMLYSPNGITK